MLKSISSNFIKFEELNSVRAEESLENSESSGSSSETISESIDGYQWEVNRKEKEKEKENNGPQVIDKSLTVVCKEAEAEAVTTTSNNSQNYRKPRLFEHKYTLQLEDKGRIKKKNNKHPISICLLNCKYDVIPRVAKQLGFKTTRPHNLNAVFNKSTTFEFNYDSKLLAQRQNRQECEVWSLCWTDGVVNVEFCREMRRFQKINHFPGMFEICRKDLLARNLNRMLRLFPNDYNIFPKSWCFPADLGDAIQYSRMHRNKTFILKPDQGSQGRGIWITKNLRDVKTAERMICQVYITKPLLIDCYKFDLRVYTLVTSTDPLRIFVYNEGLARFATTKYKEPTEYNNSNIFMHLTNYSVNKHSRMYSSDDEIGTKRKISTLNRILASEGYDVAELWANIDDVIIKTILSALPMLRHSYNASFPSHDMIQACFEILGMDILIDSKMKPFILEVNHSPSFHTVEQVDKEVKEALIRDTLVLLNLTSETRKKVIDDDRKRIRNRLLAKIKDGADDLGNSTESYLDKHHNWSQQIEWEDKHLGGYRRIMPCPIDKFKYQKFYVQQNQLSIYCDTTASKRREECAKHQRDLIEEKFKANKQLLAQFKKHNLSGEDETIKKKKVKKFRNRDFFKPDEIFECDERERLNSMESRKNLCKNLGLLQSIYVNFHRQQLLTDSDRRKYKELFSKLIGSLENSLSLPALGSVQSKSKLKNVNKFNANFDPTANYFNDNSISKISTLENNSNIVTRQ